MSVFNFFTTTDDGCSVEDNGVQDLAVAFGLKVLEELVNVVVLKKSSDNN